MIMTHYLIMALADFMLHNISQKTFSYKSSVLTRKSLTCRYVEVRWIGKKITVLKAECQKVLFEVRVFLLKIELNVLADHYRISIG